MRCGVEEPQTMPNVKNRLLGIFTNKRNNTFEFYASAYLELKKSKTKNTHDQAYFILKNHLLPYFGNSKIHLITEYEVLKYLSIKTKKRKVYDHIKHLKGVLKLARLMGAGNSEFTIKCPDQKASRGKVFKRKELAKLLWECRDKAWGRRKRPLALQIRMAYSTGMRRGEILGFKYEYLNSKGWVYLPANTLKTKQTTDRAFPLPKSLVRIIRARKRRNPSALYLFQNAQGIRPTSNNPQWSRLRKKAHIKGRFHDLRHTHATWLLQILPAKFVVKLLGMSEEVLNRYVHVPEELAQNAINRVTRIELLEESIAA